MTRRYPAAGQRRRRYPTASFPGYTGVAVVDDYESYSPNGSAALTDNYSGETGEYSITTDNAKVAAGSQALQIDSDVNFIWSNPGDGLENYPSDGDTFRCIVYLVDNIPETGEISAGVGWGEQGEQEDAISVDFREADNEFAIVNWGGGVTNTTLASTTINYDTQGLVNSLIEVEVTWDNNASNAFTVDLYDGLIDNGASKVVDGLTADNPDGRTNGGVIYHSRRSGFAWDEYRIVG